MQINQSYNPSAKNKPAFKMKINFVDANEFARIKNGLKGAFEVGNLDNFEWTLNEAAIKKQEAFTLGVKSCTTGVIINPKTKREYVFHLSPDETNCDNLAKIKQTIFEEAQKLKGKTKEPLQGLIAGANNSHYRYDFSNDLFQNINEIFKKISKELGMDYSVFAGRRDCASEINLISDAKNATVCINANSNFIKITKPKSLLNYFETKKVAQDDKVLINNQDITQNFKELTAKPKSLSEFFKKFLTYGFV